MWSLRYAAAIGIVSVLIPIDAQAEFVPMDEHAMKAALTDQTVNFAAASQTFYASGRTLYDAGRPSWGYWRITQARYCSQWPPSGLWACYDMARDGDVIRFISDDGHVTDGTLER